MKLRRLEVENYGIFREQCFEFDSDFTLVFGPNEAGKSTLLQLIREQLLGFRLQNPYSFASHAGEMAATAELELADGGRLRFRRRKGKKDVVVGELLPAGHKIDAANLANLLGGMTPERYEHLFGFSLEELTAGQASLNEANIGEALYGGAIGGLANFQNIRTQLRDEAEAIFTPRGRTKIVDNILRQLKEQTKELRSKTVKPREYEQLARECETAAAEVERLRKRVMELRRDEAHAARVSSALEPWLRCQRAEEELAELSVPPDLPLDAAAQLAQLKSRRDELASELQSIENDLHTEQRELQALKLTPDLLDREAQIRQLQQQIKQIESCRSDLVQLAQESKTIRSNVATRLRDLHPNWDRSQLERFESTIVQRETIERLERQREQLDHKRGALAGERRAIEADIASLQQQLQQVGATDSLDNLAALLDDAPSYQQDRQRSAELREQAAEIVEHMNAAIARLNAPLSVTEGGRPLCADDVSLPVPMEATVVEHRERLQHTEHERREVQRQADSTTRELADRREHLDQLESRSSVPDRDQLLAQRKHRDDGWEMIRQRFVEGKAPDDDGIQTWLGNSFTGDASDLPAALTSGYEQSVSSADKLADERQEKYELAAKRDQLTDEINRLQQQLATETQAVERCQQRQAKEQQTWESLWEACPFQPLSADAMLDWLRDYGAFVEAHRQHRVLLRKIDSLELSVSDYEQRLATSIPDDRAKAGILLSKARQLVDASRDAAVRRRTFEEQLLQKQQAVRTTDDAVAELDAKDVAWQASWQALLDEFAFPHQWDVHIAAKILAGLADARSEADKADSLDQRINDMQQEVATFESQTRELCAHIADDLGDFLAEHAISRLFNRLESARQAERDRDRLTRSSAKLEKRRSDVRGKLDQTKREIDRLMKLAGTDDEREFEQVAAAALRFAELSRVRDEADREVSVLRATEDPDAFADELRRANPDAIAAQQQMLAKELNLAEEEANAALKSQTLLDNRHQEMETGSRAAELAQDIEGTRGQLATAVDRWAPLVLARALMKQAIDKFEREHQPAVMADVGRLLAQMTLDRYTAIERKLDGRGTLLVVDDSGNRKTPQQLSTGTREQLYLAIRLAYIQHYCRDTEPLPIVMDDVLVNFDTERARQTLTALTEISDNVQIIFLTCHEHMVQMLHEVRPQSHPVVLPGGELPPGSVVNLKAKEWAVPKK